MDGLPSTLPEHCVQIASTRPYGNIGWFFVVLSLLVVAGFSPAVPGTPFFGYVSQLAGGGDIPAVIHIHAAVAMAWLALLCVQPFLIRAQRPDLHRRLGWASLALAALLLVTAVQVTQHAWTKAIALFPRDAVLSLLAQPFTGLALFLACYTLALANRRRLHRHVAFMVGAALAVASPGLARLGLYLAGGAGILAVIAAIYLTLLAFMLHARLRWRQTILRSPWWIVIALFLAAHALDLAGSGTAAWRAFAEYLVVWW